MILSIKIIELVPNPPIQEKSIPEREKIQSEMKQETHA